MRMAINLPGEYDSATGDILVKINNKTININSVLAALPQKDVKQKKLLTDVIDEWFAYIKGSIEKSTYEGYEFLFKHVKLYF